MFQIGDKVFYPTGGVCIIDDIRVMTFAGMPHDRSYYCMHPVMGGTDSIFIPVDSPETLLRPLITPEYARTFLESLSQLEVLEPCNVKVLKEHMNQALASHDCLHWFRILKTIFHHELDMAKKSKRISDTERSMADTARRYLYGELATVLDMSLTQVEDCLHPFLQEHTAVAKEHRQAARSL